MASMVRGGGDGVLSVEQGEALNITMMLKLQPFIILVVVLPCSGRPYGVEGCYLLLYLGDVAATYIQNSSTKAQLPESGGRF